jgi:hypothetical protein
MRPGPILSWAQPTTPLLWVRRRERYNHISSYNLCALSLKWDWFEKLWPVIIHQQPSLPRHWYAITQILSLIAITHIFTRIDMRMDIYVWSFFYIFISYLLVKEFKYSCYIHGFLGILINIYHIYIYICYLIIIDQRTKKKVDFAPLSHVHFPLFMMTF